MRASSIVKRVLASQKMKTLHYKSIVCVTNIDLSRCYSFNSIRPFSFHLIYIYPLLHDFSLYRWKSEGMTQDSMLRWTLVQISRPLYWVILHWVDPILSVYAATHPLGLGLTVSHWKSRWTQHYWAPLEQNRMEWQQRMAMLPRFWRKFGS